MTGKEITPVVKRELRTLSKDNAEGVAKHLVMVERLMDVDQDAARAHAEHAVGRAGRVASVREARGLVAYVEGDWKTALKEFRTAQRLSGTSHLLPYIVDCERATGRSEHALELAQSPESLTLDPAGRVELDIVVSGIRRDMGDLDAALVQLRGPELNLGKRQPWSGRLFYAYADTLQQLGREEEAREWFAAAVDADPQLGTDAAERLDDIDGTVFLDFDEDEDEDEAAEDDAAESQSREPSQTETETDTDTATSTVTATSSQPETDIQSDAQAPESRGEERVSSHTPAADRDEQGTASPEAVDLESAGERHEERGVSAASAEDTQTSQSAETSAPATHRSVGDSAAGAADQAAPVTERPEQERPQQERTETGGHEVIPVTTVTPTGGDDVRVEPAERVESRGAAEREQAVTPQAHTPATRATFLAEEPSAHEKAAAQAAERLKAERQKEEDEAGQRFVQQPFVVDPSALTVPSAVSLALGAPEVPAELADPAHGDARHEGEAAHEPRADRTGEHNADRNADHPDENR